ncbi:DUF2922 domain-containing protein [Limosilactobacillus mucosae]|uniref:DUF2922 domain-containing protein n=1 Tax=Limosilactobacillus mucosae TaxID=97478 RepID=UPI0022E6BB1A|nr:DUF2922 domain-containing protein [Limosilactobacillus mucosae]
MRIFDSQATDFSQWWLTVHNAKPDLKEETILPVMKSLATLKLFQHSDEFLYEQPVSAKYVDVQETVVFDNSPKVKELPY